MSKSDWRDRKVETRRMRVGDILPHPMNPKVHPEHQMAPLRGLLETVGKLDDLKAYRSERAGGALVFFDGHGRQALDVNAEWDVDIYDLSDAEADLAVATFDPIGWQAEQSRVKLDELLREVSTGNEALMDLLTKQAEDAGIIPLNGNAPGAGGDDFDTTPEETQTRVEYGDLWQCGEHRVLCGDSTKGEDVARVMQGEKAQMVFTDPPYGMNLDTDWSDVKGSLRLSGASHGTTGNKYDRVTGDDKPFDPTHIFQQFGYVHEMFLWGADYYAERIPNRIDGSWLVWDKRKESQSEAIGSEFELCWSKSKHKRRTLRHDWFGFLSSDNATEARHRVHPNQKPTSLVADIYSQWGNEGDVVVDLYGGSGTTLIACERTNRKARVIEIEPKYVNVILSRWEAETGKTAQLLERRNP